MTEMGVARQGMLGSAVFEMSASESQPRIAAAQFEGKVQIWDVAQEERANEIQTIFVGGARNLALAPKNDLLLVGKSKRNGVIAAYEVKTGRMMWERRGLIYPSSLQFSPSGDSVLCTCNERSSVLRLDANTGVTLETMKGVKLYIEGDAGDVLVVPPRGKGRKGDPFRLMSRFQQFEVESLSFAVLDVRFSPQAVCLSEAGGPVRCVSCINGRLLWQFNPEANSQVTRLYFSPRLGAWFGMLRELEKKISRVIRFDLESGESERIYESRSWDFCFVRALDQAVTASGDIIDLANGTLQGKLKFPLREYPTDVM